MKIPGPFNSAHRALQVKVEGCAPKILKKGRTLLESLNSSQNLLTSIKISQLYDGLLDFIPKIVKNCSELKRLRVRVCAPTTLKCCQIVLIKLMLSHFKSLKMSQSVPGPCAMISIISTTPPCHKNML